MHTTQDSRDELTQYEAAKSLLHLGVCDDVVVDLFCRLFLLDNDTLKIDMLETLTTNWDHETVRYTHFALYS